MNLVFSIQIGLREILAHKFRSFLTVFGVILGVSSLNAMFATIEGMTRGLKEELLSTGGVERFNVIDQEVPLEQEDIKSISPGRTLADAEAIQRECPTIIGIAPESNFNTTIQYSNKVYRVHTRGITPSFFSVNNFQIELGRPLSQLDLDSNSQVCIISWIIWEQLQQTRNDSPVGKTIKINDIPFHVVGVFEEFQTEFWKRRNELKRAKGIEIKNPNAPPARGPGSRAPNRYRPLWHKNNIAVIPITTMQTVFKSASIPLDNGQMAPDPKLSVLSLKVDDVNHLDLAIEQARAAILKVHRGIEDFNFETRQDWAQEVELSVRAIRINGITISSISLIVGGIGIANIMLASITERIREIGIRMAVGARRVDIFFQVIVESSIIGILGGLVGILASYGIVEFIKRVIQPDNEPIILLSNLLLSCIVAAITGLLAGIVPAFRASKLHPIQALRYE